MSVRERSRADDVPGPHIEHQLLLIKLKNVAAVRAREAGQRLAGRLRPTRLGGCARWPAGSNKVVERKASKKDVEMKASNKRRRKNRRILTYSFDASFDVGFKRHQFPPRRESLDDLLGCLPDREYGSE